VNVDWRPIPNLLVTTRFLFVPNSTGAKAPVFIVKMIENFYLMHVNDEKKPLIG